MWIKPLQFSRFDYDDYLAAPRQFGVDEWINLLLQRMSFNLEFFDPPSKLNPLIWLIPYCEHNSNLIS